MNHDWETTFAHSPDSFPSHSCLVSQLARSQDLLVVLHDNPTRGNQVRNLKISREELMTIPQWSITEEKTL